MADTSNTILGGAEFLLQETQKGDTYTPESFNEEQNMVGDMVREFLESRVKPVAPRIEKLEDGLSSGLMKEMGELGILSAHIPENYGGMEMDFIANTIIAENMGSGGSISVTYSAHTGIGMLPILYFGTEEQKLKYLPKLASGEWIASYCLTEPSSGSDALAAKTTAMLSDDGKHYVLNGQKMWITNAGWADVFIVFAQVDGDKFTGFVVEKGTAGMTLGAEEDKLGIKGSSTRQVFFENASVPVENILGKIGEGHLIAFNVLNIGRYKLGVSCLGGCKAILDESIAYAKERIQFGVPIANFGAIKHKIAEQYRRIYLLESVCYRVAGMMNGKIKSLVGEGKNYAQSKFSAAYEYALEASIIKILGSEVLDFVVDEMVQIHGGMGYSEEAKPSRAYRDARINRIFEGTNEINRLLIMSLIFKKARKGTFDLASKAMSVQTQLMSGLMVESDIESPFPIERQTVENLKKVFFMLSGYAGQLAMSQNLDLKEAQEPLMDLSDIVLEIFTLESLLLRMEKNEDDDTNLDVLNVSFYEGCENVRKQARDIVGSIVDESLYGAMLSGIKKLCHYPIQNTMKLRRDITAKLLK